MQGEHSDVEGRGAMRDGALDVVQGRVRCDHEYVAPPPFARTTSKK